MTYYEEFVECNYCHRKIKGKAQDAGMASWDWATGYDNGVRTQTEHACPDCQKEKWFLRKSQIKNEQVKASKEYWDARELKKKVQLRCIN